ncbi:PucR family transcriptional regulator [Amycolatopsis taiwanensis]|uniref:PucR C-terminal helix-turn-helix domain-containing protein n=1 Tax=Amycolatopsis taiwanensis TaxID=342230 RepID=A0A9W6VKX1_9PSEU|nr:PucR family transcriptional regulator [Amycolatopsis taiwanensis]GLY69921.1 hypothetical protein Atai01_65400 [Amycolatopsis taiwanensis]
MYAEESAVGGDRPFGGMARRHRLAAMLRPELPSLVDELVREIRGALPDYQRLGRAHGVILRRRVEYLAKLFVDLVEHPQSAGEAAGKTCRALGRVEGHAGRTLDSLHAAFRIGGRVGWRRIARVGRRRGLSTEDVSWLADQLFAFLDELCARSTQGYRQGAVTDADRDRRRRLLHLVLRRPSVSPFVIDELAATAGWVVPDQCALVALDGGRYLPRAPALGPDVLADLRGPVPCMLLPGPVTTERIQRLCLPFRGTHLAIGPTVALAEAASSLRWARQALRLVAEGVLPDVPVTVCAEHYSTLWLLADPGLLRQVARRRLAPFARFPVKQRSRLADTLFAWLQAQGNAREAAARLSVHPRTVRYRMRQIETAFGAGLRDPDVRFEIESALRALHVLNVSCDA